MEPHVTSSLLSERNSQSCVASLLLIGSTGFDFKPWLHSQTGESGKLGDKRMPSSFRGEHGRN